MKFLKEGQVRIKNNKQKLVWLPLSCFVNAETAIPAISRIKIDDTINNPHQDCVEVTIEFENGEKRWTTFTTPLWIESYLGEHNHFLPGKGLVILKQINQEAIERTIIELDKRNELIEHTIKY